MVAGRDVLLEVHREVLAVDRPSGGIEDAVAAAVQGV